MSRKTQNGFDGAFGGSERNGRFQPISAKRASRTIPRFLSLGSEHVDAFYGWTVGNRTRLADNITPYFTTIYYIPFINPEIIKQLLKYLSIYIIFTPITESAYGISYQRFSIFYIYRQNLWHFSITYFSWNKFEIIYFRYVIYNFCKNIFCSRLDSRDWGILSNEKFMRNFDFNKKGRHFWPNWLISYYSWLIQFLLMLIV